MDDISLAITATASAAGVCVLSYLAAKCASIAYFQEKFNYHQRILRSIQTEESASGKQG